MPGISLALTLACNALSISSLWAGLLRGAAMPVKGAAGIMLADARAAVRNSASRRVIGPVICLLKMRPLALPREGRECKQEKHLTRCLGNGRPLNSNAFQNGFPNKKYPLTPLGESFPPNVLAFLAVSCALSVTVVISTFLHSM